MTTIVEEFSRRTLQSSTTGKARVVAVLHRVGAALLPGSKPCVAISVQGARGQRFEVTYVRADLFAPVEHAAALIWRPGFRGETRTGRSGPLTIAAVRDRGQSGAVRLRFDHCPEKAAHVRGPELEALLAAVARARALTLLYAANAA